MKMQSDNGVLGSVMGDEISQAMVHLPRAAPGLPEAMTGETESLNHGRVRVTFQLTRNKHNKSVMWYWRPTHAEPIASSE